MAISSCRRLATVGEASLAEPLPPGHASNAAAGGTRRAGGEGLHLAATPRCSPGWNTARNHQSSPTPLAKAGDHQGVLPQRRGGPWARAAAAGGRWTGPTPPPAPRGN
jgi:hypothetical protein